MKFSTCSLICATLLFCGSEKVIAQTPAQRKIEDQYLAAAKKNIEQYRKGDVTVTFTDGKGKPLKNAEVWIAQTTQDFLFGNLAEDMLSSAFTESEKKKFSDRFLELFNFTELNVKWGKYEPEQGITQWSLLRDKLAWCKKNGVTPKGHALGWTNMSGTPGWLLKLPADRANSLYNARIDNLVGGFKNQIRIWDVVNEPVTTITWERALRDSVFGESKIAEGSRYKVDGITVDEIVPWVARSFKTAYQANPSGDFILNEFSLIAKPQVREKFFQLVKALQKNNVLITGIGIQAHEPRDMWFSPQQVVTTFDSLARLGVPLNITEFIPQSSGKAITGIWRQGTWTEDAQADFAEQFYILAFGHPAIKSIHWWGLCDRAIWLPGGGLLDKDLEPKPVYNRLLKLIKHDWMTKDLQLKTDRNGKVSFRGFYGNYNVSVLLPDGKRSNLTTGVHQGRNNIYTLTVE